MKEHYKEAFDHMFAHEGGYVNDSTDRGGETIFGIARRFHPTWSGWAIIDQAKRAGRELTQDELHTLKIHAADFYKRVFWNPLSLDFIESKAVCIELFDTAVNQGAGTAAKYLQESLNVLNRNGLNYPDLRVDGKIGPKTLEVANNKVKEAALLKTLNGLQFMRYYNICVNDRSQEKFFNGWLNRVNF